ncbi:MAG: hypothetical protein ABIO70_17475 [Pseudomonadota bacterium]
MTALALLWVGASSAASVLLTVGPEAVTNDPFLHRYGLSTGVELEPTPLVRVGLSGAFYPDRHDRDWKPLTTQLVENNHISPDLSPMLGRAQGVIRVLPLRMGLGKLTCTTGFGAGAGVVYTSDDLEALQQEEDLYAQATENQLHPALLYGLSSEIGGTWVRGRVRIERFTYIETVFSTTLEHKANLFAALDLVIRL